MLFIGRTMARKGGYDLLSVHHRWLADRCELVLVTQDDVPPARNVTVVDDVRPGDGKLDALLAAADVFVLPSAIDQWPNAVMEAMAAGVPPVVSAVGGMPEMVLPRPAGVVLADTAPETLRDAILGLLDDPERRRVAGCGRPPPGGARPRRPDDGQSSARRHPGRRTRLSWAARNGRARLPQFLCSRISASS